MTVNPEGVNVAWARRGGRGQPRQPRTRRRLEVVCWCEQTILLVDAERVRRGETGSCGPACSRVAARRQA